MIPAIEIQRLNKSFGNLVALEDIQLSIAQGEFFALLGPNGAGKTTLISIVAGLVMANSGQVKVMGHNVVTSYSKARSVLGVVPQELVFDPFFTVRETLVFQSGYYGIRKNKVWIDEILHRLDLADKADTNMRALSGGMKRRVLIAQALVHKPPVIILDEPTAGVDVELRQALWSFVKQLNQDGHTIVLTTHYLEEAEALCQHVAMLKKGKIIVLDSIRNLIDKIRDISLQLRLACEVLPMQLIKWSSIKQNECYIFKIQDYLEISEILTILKQEEIEILEMKLQEPDLEEVFIRMMSDKSFIGT
ncbi:MAG TPA: ABC transporter ATP-binding protein [Nitrosomonas sp.]|nr:ABC transporter ATP-binding protein [Nitrosomonas sp.]HMW69994.1 ABC transporter ATP-binding protein [Nitrosomonas sp.]HMY60484.1 ABC transporter ATP-binding protein [Nitrosomonas sp.]HMY90287.1 ABC transporter ATP-binding protein [Nitrosomonas sp.]HNA71022.1 ABC transporter ATP-binding protein [Nitrosomonas sp.]